MSGPRATLTAYAASGAVESAFACPYTPETLVRSFAHAGTAGSEMITMTFVLDATDALANGDPTAARFGIHPQLALLEHLFARPWLVLSWGASRVLPVQPVSAGVTETAFDGALNPLRAEVTLTLTVITASTDAAVVPFVKKAAELATGLATLVQRAAT